MKPTGNESQRTRAHLELIQADFGRLAAQYPPLYHERFVTNLHVSRESWQAFADAFPFSGLWENWHIPADSRWIGRFFGNNEGRHEFRRLCESLSELFPQIQLDSAVMDWIDILHYIGALFPSPLLCVNTTIWNWHWADHLGEEVDTRQSPEPHLEMLTRNRVKGVYYPTHPIQGVLSCNVFTASVAAIQIILEPGIVVREMPESANLPIVLSPLQPEQPTAKIDDAIFLNPDGTLPDYIFKQVPQGWVLRFAQSGSRPEQQPFWELIGLHHFQKLLSSPDKWLSVWEIYGQPAPAVLPGSIVTAEEYLAQFEENEDFRGFLFEGGSHEGRIDDEEVARLKEYASSLSGKLQTETDPQIRKELKKDLREATRRIDKRWEEIARNNGTFRVFNRIKTAMFECRKAIEGAKMYLLLGHLETFVIREGWGYAYRPRQRLPWQF